MAETYRPMIKLREFRKTIQIGDKFDFKHEQFNQKTRGYEKVISNVEVIDLYPHLVILQIVGTKKKLTASFSDLLLNSSLKKVYGLENKRIEKEKK